MGKVTRCITTIDSWKVKTTTYLEKKKKNSISFFLAFSSKDLSRDVFLIILKSGKEIILKSGKRKKEIFKN